MAGTRRVTLREASEELGVSDEAVRKRVKRGSLRSDKDPDGRVYVYLDTGGDTFRPVPEVEASALVEELRDRVRFLEGQVDARTEELKEHRRIIAALTSRIPELPPAEDAPRNIVEHSEDEEDLRDTAGMETRSDEQRQRWHAHSQGAPRGSRQNAEDEAERAEPHPDAPGAREGTQHQQAQRPTEGQEHHTTNLKEWTTDVEDRPQEDAQRPWWRRMFGG